MASSTPIPQASEDNPSNTSQEFTFFPKLPFEMVNMIWKWALPGSRIITIQSRPRLDARDYPLPAMSYLSLNPACKVNVNPIATPLLHACSRSRQIALMRYEVAFGSQLKHPIYFDWDRDIVYLKGNIALQAFTGGWSRALRAAGKPIPEDIEELRAKIRHVVIGRVPVTYAQRKLAIDQLSNFVKLYTVTWVWSPCINRDPAIVAFMSVKEKELQNQVKAIWKKKLQVEDEAALPQLEFIAKTKWKQGLEVIRFHGHLVRFLGIREVIEGTNMVE